MSAGDVAELDHFRPLAQLVREVGTELSAEHRELLTDVERLGMTSSSEEGWATLVESSALKFEPDIFGQYIETAVREVIALGRTAKQEGRSRAHLDREFTKWFYGKRRPIFGKHFKSTSLAESGAAYGETRCYRWA